MKQTLWTIQHRDAYEAFEKTGVLRANEDHLFCGDDLRFAYDWIAEQMKTRIGLPPEGVRYPVWAWYQWEGKRKRRDLRCSGYARRGTPLVQIAFEAEEGTFLRSDFDAWHRVLNHAYNAESAAEYDLMYHYQGADRREKVLLSWERIFDMGWRGEWVTPMTEKTIQVTLWELRMEQVKRVEHFCAK